MNLKKIVFIAPMIFSTIVQAGVWEERALLERYAEQLEALNKTLLVDAQQTSDPNARISMNYPALLKDSDEIVRKIKHHLNSPLEEYRQISIGINPEEVETR